MSDEMVPASSKDLASILGVSTDVSAEVTAVMGAGSGFMPRIQLMTASSPEVKNGKFKGMNHMAMVEGENLVDLGEGVDALVLAARSLAIDKNGTLPSGETGTVFCHDPKLDGKGQPTGLFKQIMERSSIKDSGAFFGPEFLLYLPSVGKYVTFLMGSKTARNDAHTVSSRIGKAVTIIGHEIPNKKFGNYFSPSGIPCSTVFELPDTEEMLTQVDKFKNPVMTAAAEPLSDEEKAATEVDR